MKSFIYLCLLFGTGSVFSSQTQIISTNVTHPNFQLTLQPDPQATTIFLLAGNNPWGTEFTFQTIYPSSSDQGVPSFGNEPVSANFNIPTNTDRVHITVFTMGGNSPQINQLFSTDSSLSITRPVNGSVLTDKRSKIVWDWSAGILPGAFKVSVGTYQGGSDILNQVFESSIREVPIDIELNGLPVFIKIDTTTGVPDSDEGVKNYSVSASYQTADSDSDSDGDGVENVLDLCPETQAGEAVDANGCSASQLDSDNDGVPDINDAFPFDPSESVDTDNDGIGNNADNDDDGDGVLDVNDAYPLISLGALLDTDSDGTPNDCDASCTALGMAADDDDDGDGVADVSDAFPLDASEQYDTDGDLIGDNADLDDDNDSVQDTNDYFPLIAIGALLDSDGDGSPDFCDANCLNDGMDRDIDSDGDGLIEIATLDQLDQMRHSLTGETLGETGSETSVGCGATVSANCAGYELVTDLDFDENGNGLPDDAYTAGEGWDPIGIDGFGPYEFSATFEGNGYRILNLMIDVTPEINNSSYYYSGLFNTLNSDAVVRNLSIVGEHVSISINSDYVGILAGKSSGAISNVYVSGRVVAQDYAGGLVGSNSGVIERSVSVGEVSGQFYVGGLTGFNSGAIDETASHTDVLQALNYGGGLVGRTNTGSDIRNSYTSAFVAGRSIGGLIGSASNSHVENVLSAGIVEPFNNASAAGFAAQTSNITVVGAHWDTDRSGYLVGVDSGAPASGLVGLTTSELTCPTAPESFPGCASEPIYDGWDTAIWTFGSSEDLPHLLNIPAYLDSDSDGVLDNLDDFPLDPSETEDTDGDRIGNNADDDDDGDGIPD